MNEQRFAVNETPEIVVVSCEGNLVVKSWRETAVSIQGPSFTAEQPAANSLRITAVGDLYLAVPQKTRLTLGRVGGSLAVKHVSGGVSVDDVGGPVTLRNVDAITITHAAQAVQGDNVNGALIVQEVGGDVALRSASGVQIHQALGHVTLQFINGHVTLGEVAGKVDARTVNGDVGIEKAQGDVVLANLGGQARVTAVSQSIWLVGGLANGVHSLTAGANVYVYWPPDAPVNLTAHGALVEHRLPLEKATQTTENGQTTLTGRIEEGQVDLLVQAGQRAAFKSLAAGEPQFTAADFEFAVETAVAPQLEAAIRAVFAEIAAELPPTTLAQLTAVRLEERLITAVTASQPPNPPANPPTNPPVDPSRHILQLLKDGLLTVEQAQLLLEAAAS